jgi:poly(A) polymerase
LDDYQHALQLWQRWTTTDIMPAPLVTGDDLIALGLSPGPRFKTILARVEDEQLDGRLHSHAQAMSFVREMLEP